MSAILLNLQHQVLQQTFRYKKFFLYIERTSLVANKISHQIFCQEHGESLEFFFPLSKKLLKDKVSLEESVILNSRNDSQLWKIWMKLWPMAPKL